MSDVTIIKNKNISNYKKIWVNGIPQIQLPVLDRAVQFGDGCFTTATVYNNRVILLKLHLQRLQENCHRLLIKSPNFKLLKKEIKHIVFGQTKAVLKIILTSGIGGPGYSRINCSESTRIILLSHWPEHYTPLQQRGAILITSPIPLARNQFLAGIKHLNRLEQVLIRQIIDKIGRDEALVLDTEGNVVECCTANLFWRKGNNIYTPCLRYAGINGIMRQYILEKLSTRGQICQIVSCKREAIIDADEVIICNSLMPIIPVQQIDNVQFNLRTLYQQFYKICQDINFS